jgi:hypothetical protein
MRSSPDRYVFSESHSSATIFHLFANDVVLISVNESRAESLRGEASEGGRDTLLALFGEVGLSLSEVGGELDANGSSGIESVLKNDDFKGTTGMDMRRKGRLIGAVVPDADAPDDAEPGLSRGVAGASSPLCAMLKRTLRASCRAPLWESGI